MHLADPMIAFALGNRLAHHSAHHHRHRLHQSRIISAHLVPKTRSRIAGCQNQGCSHRQHWQQSRKLEIHVRSAHGSHVAVFVIHGQLPVHVQTREDHVGVSEHYSLRRGGSPRSEHNFHDIRTYRFVLTSQFLRLRIPQGLISRGRTVNYQHVLDQFVHARHLVEGRLSKQKGNVARLHNVGALCGGVGGIQGHVDRPYLGEAHQGLQTFGGVG